MAASQQKSPQECRNTIQNFLHLLGSGNRDVTAEVFAREIAETEKCVRHQPELEKLVSDYREFVTPVAYYRMKEFNQDPTDKARCNEAFVHYKHRAQQALRRSLPLHLRLWDTCTVEPMFALYGLVAGIFIGAKGARMMRNPALLEISVREQLRWPKPPI